MAAIKERFQNPCVDDTVNLRLFTYNSNNPSDFNSVVQVDIYFLDPAFRCEKNPDGRRLVETLPGDQISHTDVGLYVVPVVLSGPEYGIGQYLDIWTVSVQEGDSNAMVENHFEIYPNLWYTSPIPIVYDFAFVFRPNKIRQGSKKYLIVDITPNVPKASDLARYYQQLAIVSPLQITIQQVCGDCLPAESDLRIIVENDPVTLREKTVGYYFLDTTDMDCGMYDVWFTMQFGESLHISDKQQLQIF